MLAEFRAGDTVLVSQPIGDEDKRYTGFVGTFLGLTPTHGFARVQLRNGIEVLLHPESLTAAKWSYA